MSLPSAGIVRDPLGPGGTAGIAQKLLGSAVKPNKLLMQQITELLSTGGVGARIPIIQRAVEAQMAASGQAAQRSRELTARAGLTGSAFDVSNQLTNQSASSAAAAAVGPNMAAAMLSGAPAAIHGTAQLGLEALSQETRRRTINVANYAAFMNAIRESFTSWYGGSGGGGSTAGSIYGGDSGGGGYSMSAEGGQTLTPVGSSEGGGSILSYG